MPPPMVPNVASISIISNHISSFNDSSSFVSWYMSSSASSSEDTNKMFFFLSPTRLTSRARHPRPHLSRLSSHRTALSTPLSFSPNSTAHFRHHDWSSSHPRPPVVVVSAPPMFSRSRDFLDDAPSTTTTTTTTMMMMMLPLRRRFDERHKFICPVRRSTTKDFALFCFFAPKYPKYPPTATGTPRRRRRRRRHRAFFRKSDINPSSSSSSSFARF